MFHRWGDGENGNLKRFIVALNFSDENREVTLSFPENGRWSDVLADRDIEVFDHHRSVTLERAWGHIYFLR